MSCMLTSHRATTLFIKVCTSSILLEFVSFCNGSNVKMMHLLIIGYNPPSAWDQPKNGFSFFGHFFWQEQGVLGCGLLLLSHNRGKMPLCTCLFLRLGVVCWMVLWRRCWCIECIPAISLLYDLRLVYYANRLDFSLLLYLLCNWCYYIIFTLCWNRWWLI